MADAWGGSWGTPSAWGVSWGEVAAAGAAEADTDGGFVRQTIKYPWQGRRYSWDRERGIVEVKAFDRDEDERDVELLLRLGG